MASHPVWEDGTPVAGCSTAPCTPVDGYPYRSAPAKYAPQTLVSGWVGLLSVALASSSGTVGRSSASLLPPVPPPSSLLQNTNPATLPPIISSLTVTPAPSSAAAFAFVTAALLLFLTALIMLAWAVVAYRAHGRDEPEEHGDKKHKHKEKHKHHSSSRAGPRPGLMLMLMLPCVAACSDARTSACAACYGVLAGDSCMCRCGWSQGESFLYGMVMLPVVGMVLLYI